ncbi:hypothetical protein MRX96_045369 [Rhipicephalus microplus]
MRDFQERVKIYQQLHTKFTNRQKCSQQPLTSKLPVQERLQKAATLRHSFYTGPRSVPSTENEPGYFDHAQQTFADGINAPSIHVALDAKASYAEIAEQTAHKTTRVHIPAAAVVDPTLNVGATKQMHNSQQAPRSTLEPQPDYEALFMLISCN